MEGVRGVFPMQQDRAPLPEFRNLLDAAIAAGVEQSTGAMPREAETTGGIRAPNDEDRFRHI